MGPLRILGKPELAAALDALCALDPEMARLRAVAGEPPLRALDPGLAGLVWLVNSQMISVTAARAIHGRIEAALGALDHARLSQAPDELFRAAGVSRGKLRTIRALCAAVDGGLDIAGLAERDEQEARATLTAIPGIGPWTADVFLLFAHGRADAFPAGDVALRAALKEAFGLPARPGVAEAERIAERWRPLRGVAARLLWAYYRAMRGGLDAVSAPSRAATVRETL